MTISIERMHVLVNQLAQAKSEQNIEAALRPYHQHIEIVAPSLDSVSNGKQAVRKGLIGFFKLLPDYQVKLSQFAYNHGVMLSSGTVTATPNTNNPAVKTATIPVCIEFHFKDDAISKEIFHLDMGLLCRKANISPSDL